MDDPAPRAHAHRCAADRGAATHAALSDSIDLRFPKPIRAELPVFLLADYRDTRAAGVPCA